MSAELVDDSMDAAVENSLVIFKSASEVDEIMFAVVLNSFVDATSIVASEVELCIFAVVENSRTTFMSAEPVDETIAAVVENSNVEESSNSVFNSNVSAEPNSPA